MRIRWILEYINLTGLHLAIGAFLFSLAWSRSIGVLEDLHYALLLFCGTIFIYSSHRWLKYYANKNKDEKGLEVKEIWLLVAIFFSSVLSIGLFLNSKYQIPLIFCSLFCVIYLSTSYWKQGVVKQMFKLPTLIGVWTILLARFQYNDILIFLKLIIYFIAICIPFAIRDFALDFPTLNKYNSIHFTMLRIGIFLSSTILIISTLTQLNNFSYKDFVYLSVAIIVLFENKYRSSIVFYFLLDCSLIFLSISF